MKYVKMQEISELGLEQALKTHAAIYSRAPMIPPNEEFARTFGKIAMQAAIFVYLLEAGILTIEKQDGVEDQTPQPPNPPLLS